MLALLLLSAQHYAYAEMARCGLAADYYVKDFYSVPSPLTDRILVGVHH